MFHIYFKNLEIMDKRKAENLRVKKGITDALFKLMKKKSISEITVTELIRTAGTARVSFYRNYSSKEDVLITLIRDVLSEFMRTAPQDISLYEHYDNILHGFRYFRRYRSYILDIDASGLGNTITKEVLVRQMKELEPLHLTVEEQYRYIMFLGAYMTIAFVWLQTGMKETTEEIARLFYRNYCLKNQ